MATTITTTAITAASTWGVGGGILSHIFREEGNTNYEEDCLRTININTDATVGMNCLPQLKKFFLLEVRNLFLEKVFSVK